MKTFEFTIVASGLNFEAEGFEDAFYGAKCDDASISVQRGAIILDFHRDSVSFDAAIDSAVADVRAAGATVVRIEPDNLVSLADISRRSGLSRSAISLYATGDRGEAFPPPVARVTSDASLWDWVQVSEWLARKRSPQITNEILEEARAIRRANRALVAGSVYSGDRKVSQGSITFSGRGFAGLIFSGFNPQNISHAQIVGTDALAGISTQPFGG